MDLIRAAPYCLVKAVIVVITLVRTPWARASRDKPHRCPGCWRIPAKANRHGRARWWAVYRCTDEELGSHADTVAPCEHQWWRGWAG